KIVSLCEASRWAPSCGADEPWRFIIWDKFSSAKEYSMAYEFLAAGNKIGEKNAPLLIAVIADTRWRSNREALNKWAPFDTGASAMALYLQAFDLGLYAHPMAGFDATKLRELFQIPQDYEPFAMVAVGYPGNIEDLESPYKERELRERNRRPLEDNFFYALWANPLQYQKLIEDNTNV
ncbi:MAG: nitroreductase family protein, partial [Candidatus Kapaibacteriota bacterium]